MPARSAQTAIVGGPALIAGATKPWPSPATGSRDHAVAEPAGSVADRTAAPSRQMATAPPLAPTETVGVSGRVVTTPETRATGPQSPVREGRARPKTANPLPDAPVHTATARPVSPTATSGVRGSAAGGAMAWKGVAAPAVPAAMRPATSPRTATVRRMEAAVTGPLY